MTEFAILDANVQVTGSLSTLGLPGATGASRYAGATTSGAPVTGTFAVGDFVVDQTGAFWVCTVAGSPGTWADTAGSSGIIAPAGDIGGTNNAPTVIATHLSSPLPPAQGGSGQATVQAAMNAFAGAVTSGQFLRGNGTNVVLAAIGTGDVPQLTNYAPTGLTGATAASRYVGATASGAPGSGTFVVGDFVVDETGSFWVCTTGGTPGTWQHVAGGSGFSNPMTTLGDLIYGGSSGTATRLAGDTSNTRKFLRELSSGGVATAPVWDTLVAGDLPGATTSTQGAVILDGTNGDIAASPGTGAAGSVGKAADAGHVHPQPTNFAPTGLTGSTAASRYVGGTASGAPGSGAHLLGDYVVDQTGSIWVCTTAGTPGTFTQISGVSGGFSNPMTTLGDIMYENASPAPARLAGNTTATKNFLVQTGNGSVSAAPAWGTVAAADLPGATTSTQGAVVLDGTAGDIAALGSQAAGAVGKAADAGHVHPTTGVALLAGATFTGYLAPAVVTLTDAATITVNAALGNDFRVTLGGNRTLGAPSNPVDGQKIVFQVSQDATGSRTLAYNAAYEFSTSLPSPTLTVTASATDLLGFIYNAAKGKWLCAAYTLGFS